MVKNAAAPLKDPLTHMSLRQTFRITVPKGFCP